MASTTKPPAAVTSFAHNPLTTAFSRPIDCHGIYMSQFLAMMDQTSTCLPRSLHTESDSYFSPGISCPSGYVTACHDNTGVASLTTITCCPTFNRDVTLSCVTTSTLRSVWSTLFCTWIAPGGRGTSLPVTLSDNGVTSTVERTFRSPGGLNAFGIRMVHQQTDVGAHHAHPPSSTPSSDADTSSATSSFDGLSTGAKIAIGVTVPVVILLLLLLAATLLRRRRRRRSREPSAAATTPHHEKYPTQELHGENVQEMMGSTADVAELPASTRR
ncbi:hypothetical protein XA68_16649 [Ophiocordyceps unilateralis]|uniref:Mid2 domain-containing protein n=1 Tax=Ophiocordyceps unilateralis TaxID=268505 RepID=A0A2A9PSS2_OPHUN|nr:hypothetical protein XA68_16649 [Ophiocordyceps unilateralis]